MTAPPPASAPPSGRVPVLLLVTGPSGSGKTTAAEQMLAHHPGLSRVITCTTRPPRPGERDGVDYHFRTPEEFAARVEAGDLLEHAEVYGRHYGTPRSGVLAQLAAGADLLLNLDVQGAATVRRLARDDATLARSLVTVFLTPATRTELERRLDRRGSEPADVRARRLAAAKAELAHAADCDYLVYSTTIPEDFARISAIYQAESWRRSRVPLPALEE